MSLVPDIRETNATEDAQQVDYVYRINDKYAHLSKGQKKIARYLMAHREAVNTSSITLLAKEMKVTPSAITRFCQALNYSGFSEMKVYFNKSILSEEAREVKIEREDSDALMIQKLMTLDQNAIAETMTLIDPKKIRRIAMICAKAKHIHFYGQGATGASAQLAMAIFLQIGMNAQSFSDSVFMRIAASSLEKNDIAFGITYSGKAYDVIEAMKIARKKGAYTVSITGKSNSPITEAGDINLIYSSSIEDELTQLPIARICETSIFGLIQIMITRVYKQSQERMTAIRSSIEQIRKTRIQQP